MSSRVIPLLASAIAVIASGHERGQRCICGDARTRQRATSMSVAWPFVACRLIFYEHASCRNQRRRKHAAASSHGLTASPTSSCRSTVFMMVRQSVSRRLPPTVLLHGDSFSMSDMSAFFLPIVTSKYILHDAVPGANIVGSACRVSNAHFVVK